jgi:hypothetical protein
LYRPRSNAGVGEGQNGRKLLTVNGGLVEEPGEAIDSSISSPGTAQPSLSPRATMSLLQ